MTEQATNQALCSATSLQMPDTLHIDLPNVDLGEVCFIINKCLVQITSEDWDLMADGFVTSVLMTKLANYCMDIVQTFAEVILDAVLPQAYRCMRTYGTFSPTLLGLSEDRIYADLGDTFEQALVYCLKVKEEKFKSTKVFSQLLFRHISTMVNSVLALSTRTPILESRLPVFFVGGCVPSIEDLQDAVYEMAIILIAAFNAQRPVHEMSEAQINQTTSSESSSEKRSLVICLNSRRDLKKMLVTHIIRMVKVLKSNAQMPHCKNTDHRDVCIRVGTNAQILTVEDDETHEQQAATSSHSGLDAIPGAVPDSNDAAAQSRSCPFSSVTVFSPAECHFGAYEVEAIEGIADELIQSFLEEDAPVESEMDHLVIDNIKLRELTDRVFSVVMGGYDYQIPFVPAGIRMCAAIAHREPGKGDVTNLGIVTHALYMMTEEVVTRCAVQVRLWSLLSSKLSDDPSPQTSDELSEEPNFILLPVNEAGDGFQELMMNVASSNLASPSTPSEVSDNTYDVIPDLMEPKQLQELEGMVHISLLSLIIWKLLHGIGYRDRKIILEAEKKLVEQIQEVDPTVYNHFHASVLGHSDNDIFQNIFSDLLLEFGSVHAIQEVVTSADIGLDEAIIRALRKQLRKHIPPVSRENAAEENNCGFFKKFQRLCYKKTLKKDGKTTPVISLTKHQDSSELQGHWREEETLKNQTERHQCPLMRRIAASTRNMFSSIVRTLDRPLVTCCSTESQ